MNQRRFALRQYFIEVARDLVARGVIHRQKGQSLEDILRTEFRRVMQEVPQDFAAVGAEVTQGLLTGGAIMLSAVTHPLAGLAGAGLQALADLIAPGKRK